MSSPEPLQHGNRREGLLFDIKRIKHKTIKQPKQFYTIHKYSKSRLLGTRIIETTYQLFETIRPRNHIKITIPLIKARLSSDSTQIKQL